MIKDKMDVMRIKHSRIITDPFPEHTNYQMTISFISQWKSIFTKWMKKDDIPRPEEISIWKAYRLGYEKAYKEIEDSLCK